jgi:ribosomal protein L31E
MLTLYIVEGFCCLAVVQIALLDVFFRHNVAAACIISIVASLNTVTWDREIQKLLEKLRDREKRKDEKSWLIQTII